LLSESQGSPKENQGSDTTGIMQTATNQVELTATKLAVAKSLLVAAEKEHQTAMDALALAAAEAEKEYAAIVKASVKASEAAKPLTNKRNEERIFRREMGEPEFFRSKKDLAPKRPILSEDEQEEISRNVEAFPVDATPQYNPQHVLSPEFAGTSNYESAINDLVAQAKSRLESLQNDPNSNMEEISRAEKDLEYLASLYESFFYSMNVFRTAHSGRAKITPAK
jgi:colicin import membrane protein